MPPDSGRRTKNSSMEHLENDRHDEIEKGSAAIKILLIRKRREANTIKQKRLAYQIIIL